MKMIKPLLSVLLVSILLFGVAACGGGSGGSGQPANQGGGQGGTQTTPAPAPVHQAVEATVAAEGANLAEHINVINDVTPIAVVNPLLPAGTGSPNSITYNLIYDTLLDQPEPGVFAPHLATSWETDDYQTFRFHLRNDVYYHNGDHLTAEEIKWYVELVLDNPGMPAWARWQRVAQVRALEPYLVEFELDNVFVDFYFDMANASAGILNRTSYEANPDDPSWAWIGTGPFRIVEFETANFVRLERFDEYWGGVMPTKSLTLWTIPELSTRTVMLQNGEAQISFNMSPEDLDMLANDPDFQIFTIRLNPPCILGFNNQGDAIMMDVNFRKAVAYALNVDDVAIVANGRWAQAPWDGNFWGPDTQYRLDGLPRRDQNLDLAREYLAQSVYDGSSIEIIASSAYNIRASEIIQLQLAEIGIVTHIEVMDTTGFVDAHTYDPDSTRQIHLFAVGMNPVAANVLRTAFSPGVFSNRLNYNDPYISELNRQYGSTFDLDERRDIIHQVQEYFYETLPAIPTFWRLNGYPAVNGIGGIRLSSDSFAFSLRGIYWDLDETPERLRPR